MKVIIDERETALFDKCEHILHTSGKTSYVILSKEVLTLGDILFQTDDNKPVLVIERKTLMDLIASIKDGRYEEQSYRLLNSSGFPPHSIIYLIEGMFSQLNNPIEKKMVQSAMTSLNFFKGNSIHRTLTMHETAEWILYMADKIERELLKGTLPYYLTKPFSRCFKDTDKEPLNELSSTESTTNETEDTLTATDYCNVVKKSKKENITPENISEILLCQIPGISSITAISIMKSFPGRGFSGFIEELKNNPACLDTIMIESGGKKRKISKSSVENIKKFLLGDRSSGDSCS